MIRTGMVFFLVLTAWQYTHQNFGSFSVHQMALQSPGTLHFQPDADRQPALLRTTYADRTYDDRKSSDAGASIWSQWLYMLRDGVAISPGLTRSDGIALNLANITPQAITVLIQSELHRVGCFRGQIDGSWNERTINSVNDFIRDSRANYIRASTGPRLDTLTALRQTIGRVCQPRCKTGFTRNADGICRLKVQAEAEPDHDAYAKVDDAHPAFLPRRNPQRVKSTPLIKADSSPAQKTASLDIPLPARNLRKSKTAQIGY